MVNLSDVSAHYILTPIAKLNWSIYRYPMSEVSGICVDGPGICDRWMDRDEAAAFVAGREARLVDAKSTEWLSKYSMGRAIKAPAGSVERSIYKDVVGGTMGKAGEYHRVTRVLTKVGHIPHSHSWNGFVNAHGYQFRCPDPLDCPFGVSVCDHIAHGARVSNEVTMSTHYFHFDPVSREGAVVDTTAVERVVEASNVNEFGILAAHYLMNPIKISADSVLIVNSTSGELITQMIWAIYIVLLLCGRRRSRDYWLSRATFVIVKPGGFGIVKFIHMSKTDITQTTGVGLDQLRVNSYLAETLCYISTKLKADIVSLTTAKCLYRVYGEGSKHRFRKSSVARFQMSEARDFENMMLSGQWVPTQAVFEAFSQDYRGIISGVIDRTRISGEDPVVYRAKIG